MLTYSPPIYYPHLRLTLQYLGRRGKPALSVPLQMLANSKESFTYAAIGRFLGRRPLLEWVEAPSRDWNLSRSCTVSLTAKGNFIFRLNSEADRDHILSLSPITMAKRKLQLLPWHPGQEETNWPTIVPLWIRFKGLRYHFWSKDILFSLANTIGKPIKLDDITTAQRIHTYARLLVNIDLSKQKPHSILVNLDGERELEIEVVCENTPCSICVNTGHPTTASPSTSTSQHNPQTPKNETFEKASTPIPGPVSALVSNPGLQSTSL
eukprot:TRINITY_DN3996_c0_g1_i4.p1 TRINITY_DN3996_c0_g1~~TRINITY_DN3996_c0_g1_i4.p1  ORF type:complete len:266 (-),score=27.52 TRINITY_DN3996_c0_g1_i4:261-1058(-)